MKLTARISCVLRIITSVALVSASGNMKSVMDIRAVKTQVMKLTAVMKLVPNHVVSIAHLGNVLTCIGFVMVLRIVQMEVMRLQFARHTVLIASTSAMIVDVSHQIGFVMESKIVSMAKMRMTAKTL